MFWFARVFLSCVFLSHCLGLVAQEEPTEADIEVAELSEVSDGKIDQAFFDLLETSGEVRLHDDTLLVPEGGMLAKGSKYGPWARAEMSLQIDSDSPTNEFQIWFDLDGVTSCYVQFRTVRNSQGATTVYAALFDTVIEDGETRSLLLAEWFDLDLDFEQFAVEYRNGMFTADSENEPVLSSYFHNGSAPVVSIRIEAKDSSLAIDRFRVLAGPDFSVELSEDQQRRLDNAASQFAQSVAAYQQGNYRDAVPLMESARDTRKEILGSLHPQYAEALNSLSILYYLTGQYDQGIPLSKEAIEIRRRVVGQRHPQYADSINNQGLLYYRKGEYEKALERYQECLAIQQKWLGEGHPFCATSLNNIALANYEIGKYDEAEVAYREAIEVQKRLFGESSPDLANTLNNLALLLDRVGDYQSARRLYEDSTEMRLVAYGERHPVYANSLNNLGSFVEKMGDLNRAKQLYEQCLNIRRETLGEGHPDYAYTIQNLAESHRKLGQYEQALELHLKASEIRKTSLGDNHPTYAMSLYNLGALYAEMWMMDEAKTAYESCKRILESTVGDQHPAYGSLLSNLGMLNTEFGDYRLARELVEKSATIREQAFGSAHPDYAMSLNNLALIHFHLGDYSRSRELSQQALQITEQAYGTEHPVFATALVFAAGSMANFADYQNAEQLCLQAIEIQRSRLGDSSLHLANSLEALSRFYNEQGRGAFAESAITEALRIRKQNLGEDHPDYANCLGMMAGFYTDFAEYARAENLYLEARTKLELTVGKTHRDYLVLDSSLAGIYMKVEEFDKAREILERNLATRMQALGEEHPETLESVNSLGACCALQKDYARAEALYKTAINSNRISLGEDHPTLAIQLANLAALYVAVGRFAEAEPLFQEAIRIQQDRLGSDHLDLISTTDAYARMLQVQGRFEDAQAHLEAMHVASVNNVHDTLPVMSAAQAHQWLLSNSPRLDLLLTNHRQLSTVDSRVVYEAVWACKALTTRARGISFLPEDGSPEAHQLAANLRDARLSLALLVSSKPSTENLDQYRSLLKEANDRKESLERQLASVSPMTKDQLLLRDAELDVLLESLPEAVAVIDFVKTNHWNIVDVEIEIESDGGNKLTQQIPQLVNETVYDAFVLRNNAESDGNHVTWVQLGESGPIDEAISQWRLELAAEAFAIDTQESEDRGLRPSSERIQPAMSAPERMSQLIWKKLESELEGCQTVIVLPDDQLNLVPWGALPGKEPGTYLIEDFAFSVAGFGQQLLVALQANHGSTTNRLLTVGDVDYGVSSSGDSNDAESDDPIDETGPSVVGNSGTRPTWSRLPGASNEVSEIARVWSSPEEITQLAGTDANEMALIDKLPLYGYVHLATHGFFEQYGEVYDSQLRQQSFIPSSIETDAGQMTIADRNPYLMSGLVLARANVEPTRDANGIPLEADGILTAEELMGLDLRKVQLVTLSACESGLGDLRAGEGVMGLTNAFHQAGADTVVSSLWKVNDLATQALMTEFYTNLWDKKLSRNEALRQAQLTVMREFDVEKGVVVRGLKRNSVRVEGGDAPAQPTRLHPRLWAAFQLSGDWR